MHLAIIMDGNGRWAQRRGLPRIAGHRAGADALRRVVEAAPDLGVRTLTIYAFSSDNWKRPQDEINGLMRMFRTYLRREQARCIENGVRVSVIGRRDRLPPLLLPAMEECERATRHCNKLHLRIAVDYSARDRIVEAARKFKGASREDFARLLEAEDVDLLIRTGGEQRLSDFLLWECAYAEFFFTPTMWPDFNGASVAEALAVFHARDRRFGAVKVAAQSRA
ncbi:MAG TPA: di-trans,poly-cis-decaprenylcistransferase [Bryobacteraceae bacterium]|nr:di-trans,poly-cis-decaprenylcistransferase [Bryobacteraceae bacterium]